MAIDPKTAIWIADVKAWNGSAEVIIRVASGANFTVGGVSAVSSGVKFVMDNPSLPSRTGFSTRNRVTGRGSTSFRDLVLRNQYGLLDQYRTYNVDGRELQFYVITPGGEFNTGAEDAGSFTMDSGIVDQDSWTIAIRGWTRSLEVPIQTSVYAGSNTPPTGLEGTSDLAGKPKPIVYGKPRNVPAVLVNPQKLIYQVADKQLQSIDAVRDAGIDLTSGGTRWTSTTFGMGASIPFDLDDDGNGVVLAVGPAGKIERSTDYGATWSTVTPPTANDFRCVRWFAAASLWIAGADAAAPGEIWTSPTGATGSWTSRTTNMTTGAPRRIEVSGTTAVVVGTAGKVVTSTNGTTWTAQTSGVSNALTSLGVAKRGSTGSYRFVAVSTTDQMIRSDDNGATWTSCTTQGFFQTLSVVVKSVCGGPRGRFVVVGSDGFVAVSDDGDVFTPLDVAATFGTSCIITAVRGSNHLFVAGSQHITAAVSDGAIIATSPDGANWTLAKSDFATARSYTGITYTGQTWVAVGSQSGSTSYAVKAPGITAFSSLSDLQDDASANLPDPGTYGVRFDTTGTYIRLGSPAFGVVTCDPVEGATSADRTHAQIFKRVIRDRGLFGVTNLLLRSAEFDNASWSKTNVTVTANNVANPIDGAVTADKVAATASAATSLNQSFTVPTPAPAALTYSVYIKKGTSATTANAFDFRNSTTATDVLFGSVNLDTGVTALSGSGRFHATAVKGQPGWLRVTLTITSGFSAGNTMLVFAAFSGGAFTAGDFSFLYGAQVEAGDTATSYIPTTSTTDVGGDWNANDLAVLDAAINDEIGVFIPDGDRVNVADVLDQVTSSARAMWFNDRDGIIRVSRLASPESNIVTNGSSLATSPWTVGGSAVATNAVAIAQGHSFSRVTTNGSDPVRQPVTLPVNDSYYLSYLIKSNGAAGAVDSLLFDSSAAISRIAVTCTIAASGVITAVATAGTLVGIQLIGDGVYHVLAKVTTGVTPVNNNFVYAVSSATAASVLFSDFKLLRGDPFTLITEPQMEGMVHLRSGDAAGDLPRSRTVIQYSRNYQPMQGTEIVGAVEGDARVLLEKEWLESATAFDSTVITAHPLATFDPEETLLVDSTDAATEATSRQTLFGTNRYFFDVPTRLDSTIAQVEIGDVVSLASTRYGMGAGTLALVLGVDPEIGDGLIGLSVWM